MHRLLFRVPRTLLSTTPPHKTPFLLTDIGEGITSVQILSYLVQKGDRVSQFQPLVEVQSDKATVQISSRYDGLIHSLAYQPGDIAPVGQPLCHILTDEPRPPAPVPDPHAQIPATPVPDTANPNIPDEQPAKPSTNPAQALPSVRRLAKQHRVDLERIQPTGKEGRVTKEDVLRQADLNRPSAEANPSSDRVQPTFTHDTNPASIGHVERIRGLRRGMVKSMTAAAKIAQLGLCDDVNMENVIALRKHLVSQLSPDGGVKFTYMPIFIKAVSRALSAFPVLNASVGSDNDSIVFHRAHNISVAMATEDGLIVPCIKDVQSLSMLEIAQELGRLAVVAKTGKFSREDLEGGTFTLSNIGSIGGTIASPVVFPPQVGIGAIGSIRKQAVVGVDDVVSTASVLSVSWAADHRIIDGATLAMFNRTWKQYVERPESMLLDLK